MSPVVCGPAGIAGSPIDLELQNPSLWVLQIPSWCWALVPICSISLGTDTSMVEHVALCRSLDKSLALLPGVRD